MNAQIIFFAIFGLGALITYPELVAKLFGLWVALIIIKLIW